MEQADGNDRFLRRVLRILSWYCPIQLREEIEGDLMQRYEKDLDTFGQAKAARLLTWNVICYFRPDIILRNKVTHTMNRFPLLTSYFKFGWRSLLRSPMFSLINVSGLSVGLVAFFLILHYAAFEMSFDRSWKNYDRIYRIAYRQAENDRVKTTSAKNLIGIRSLLSENFPEVEAHTGFWRIPANTDYVFRHDGQTFMEPGEYIFADSNFLKVFPGLLVRGEEATILNDHHNLIISESLSEKVFAGKDPIGQPIEDIVDPGNDGTEHVIAGVMRDFPPNVHFDAAIISFMGHSWDTVSNYWAEPSFYTYARLAKGTDTKKFEKRLNMLLSEKVGELPGMNGTQAFLQPITSIHLDPQLGDEYQNNGSPALVYVLLLIGGIILVIAWINYVNLETAQFISRSREIGIRRVIGSSRSSIALQFLVRYACLTAMACVVSASALFLILPFFAQLTHIPSEAIAWNLQILLTGAAVFAGGSLLVGVYPAIFLTRLKPAESIKGQYVDKSSGLFRKSLVVVQFTVSIVLIALVLVISRQVDFMRISNKHVDVDHVLAVKNAFAYADDEFLEKRKQFIGLETKLKEAAPVSMVCSSSAIPGTEIGFTLVNEIHRRKGDPYSPTRFKLLFIDYNFIPLYGLKLLAGRNYTELDEPADASAIILNEQSIRALGFASAEEAVGQTVHFPLWPWMSPDSRIVGVVEDYHHEAIKRPLMPMIFFLNRSSFQQVYFSIRFDAGTNPHEALASVASAWKQFFPDRPFEYFFLDDYYDRQFKSELQFGLVFGIFASVAVVLSCLGILGMTLFEATVRLKEISIRKVLGASLANVIRLLSLEHLRVVLISGVVATPVAWWCASEWLVNYPAQVSLAAWIFVTPIAIVGFLLLITSGLQTWRAAQTNPVDHLRRE
jgi:putative ABC transport system permease protein